jgi:hypothetical protein
MTNSPAEGRQWRSSNKIPPHLLVAVSRALRPWAATPVSGFSLNAEQLPQGAVSTTSEFNNYTFRGFLLQYIHNFLLSVA